MTVVQCIIVSVLALIVGIEAVFVVKSCLADIKRNKKIRAELAEISKKLDEELKASKED